MKKWGNLGVFSEGPVADLEKIVGETYNVPNRFDTPTTRTHRNDFQIRYVPVGEIGTDSNTPSIWPMIGSGCKNSANVKFRVFRGSTDNTRITHHEVEPKKF